ncbi:MAG: MetQ/NlpA family ABC transporter substrate-binding protein [Lachnospiraceae bacterium]|nr:MetQ/NlpA family ABC transporter substrate-binding protein [Lachnospiraceae bacterium]
MKKSKLLALGLAAAAIVGVAGCASTAGSSSVENAQESQSEAALEAGVSETGASETEQTASGQAHGITAPDGDDNHISIGVTPVPHAEIVNAVVKAKLEEAGWNVEVVEFNDYVQPNTALEDGELDANYFQTIRYLEEQNSGRGLHLVAVAGIHLEPMGFYSSGIDSVDSLADGSSISIPNDSSNGSRALKLLADNGLITLSDTEDLYDLTHIAENPHDFEFVELDAANLARSLDDVEASVINGNYALEAGLNPSADALFAEQADSDESYKYINYLVVKEGNEETAKTKALTEALQSEDVKSYIEENYQGSVIAAF